MDTFQKVRGLRHLEVPCKKSSLRMKTLLEKKKLSVEQKQKQMEEEKQKKRTEVKNCCKK